MNRLIVACVLSSALCAGAADPEPSARRTSPPGALAVVFAGDIMLDGGPGHAVEGGGDPFAACLPLLLDGDFTIGNLECVLGDEGRQVLKPYTFRAAKDAARVLAPVFSAVSVANNHALDFGPEGLVGMLAELRAIGVRQVGGGDTLVEARRPLVLEKGGLRVAILAANGFRREESAATADRAGVAPLEEDALLADIAAARREADVVIPFVHWGPELAPQPDAADRRLARRMVDAGAGAVIGCHPHVTQTVDVHHGAPIIYSLGNFVFDYFPGDPPEWTGWIVRLEFRRNAPVQVDTTAVVLDAVGLPRPAPAE